MTTIDSDSESQDSDDGRRFRFEATRKDDTLPTLQSRTKRRVSPPRKSYRSRSRDRGSRDRRDHDKSRLHDRDKKDLKNNHEKKRDSKDHEANDRHEKGSKAPTKTRSNDSKSLTTDKRSADSKNSSHRDGKDSKNSAGHKEVRDSRDSRVKESKTSSKDLKNPRDQNKDSKDSRDKDRDRKRTRSREKSATDKQRQVGNRSREGHGIRSGERSDDKVKDRLADRNGSRDDRDRSRPVAKKIPRRETEARSVKRDVRSPSKILEQIGSDSESDLGALDPDVGPVLTLDKFQECGELNLSDFDIVSDTEGSCSEESATAAALDVVKDSEPRVKKLVSRRQYERLVRRQAAAKNRRRAETQAQRKVIPRNGDHHHAVVLAGHSNNSNSNNPSAVSDFLLGTETPASTPVREVDGRARPSKEHRKYPKSEEQSSDQDSSELSRDGKDKSGSTSLGDQNEKSSLIEDTSSKANRNDSRNHRSSSSSTDNQLNIYGPVLPPGANLPLPVENSVPGEAGFPSCKSKDEYLSSPKHNVPAISPAESDTNTRCGQNSDSEGSEADGSAFGPCPPAMSGPVAALPPQLDQVTKGRIIGPSLPPHLHRKDTESEKMDCKEASPIDDHSVLGPALPPHLLQRQSVASDSEDLALGPALPRHLRRSEIEEAAEAGPAGDSESEEDFVVGPLPPDHPAAANSHVQQQLDKRARRIKDQFRVGSEPEVKKREEWMLELPSAQAKNLGMGARQFRARAAPDMSDRSSWTDTPTDKARKRREKGEAKAVDLTEESETLAIIQRDQEMQKMAERHKSKKREESLLDIHQKKLQKKKKKEEKALKEAKEAGKPTRRPFDRDVDLQANRFDEAQKKSILKKAQLLDDRFSRGKSKFL